MKRYWYIFIIIIALIALLIVNYVATQKKFEEDEVIFTKTQAKHLTSIIKRSIKIDMLGTCGKGVQKIVDTTGEIPGIETLRIFDNKGIIKYSINHNEINKSLDELDRQRSDGAKKEGRERFAPFEEMDSPFRSFCIIEDIENEKECNECHDPKNDVIASIILCMTMETAENYMSTNQNLVSFITIIAIIIIIAALSLLITFLVNRRKSP